MQFSIQHFDSAAPDVRHTDAKAAVLHGAGNARLGIALQNRPNRIQRFDQRGRLVRNLTVWQHLTGTDGVLITEFERR